MWEDWLDEGNLGEKKSSETGDRQGIDEKIGHDVYRGQVSTYSIVLNMEPKIFHKIPANEVDKPWYSGYAIDSCCEDHR